jgi:predicted nucleic acid-binding protein
MGILAAKVDADTRKAGTVIATADLIIGVTALYYAYDVGTRNIRHFKMIPGLTVMPL